jgi:hypothetical protein
MTILPYFSNLTGVFCGMEMVDKTWTARQFVWNDRLGIRIPALQQDWDSLTIAQQAAVLAYWEESRGKIPDRVKWLESQIAVKQDRLFREEDFGAACRLNQDIMELASQINDLNIWFRTGQDLEPAAKTHG